VGSLDPCSPKRECSRQSLDITCTLSLTRARAPLKDHNSLSLLGRRYYFRFCAHRNEWVGPDSAIQHSLNLNSSSSPSCNRTNFHNDSNFTRLKPGVFFQIRVLLGELVDVVFRALLSDFYNFASNSSEMIGILWILD